MRLNQAQSENSQLKKKLDKYKLEMNKTGLAQFDDGSFLISNKTYRDTSQLLFNQLQRQSMIAQKVKYLFYRACGFL